MDISNVAWGYNEVLNLGVANEFISQQGSASFVANNAILACL
jgi:hypothetical protein